ncbi:DUF4235 domain-containing protein [Nonomuraea fuscirosea]|jgi:hypothetical protein|uniref:Uncharacterized protein DUF4235 n=1 Tax=Nonomuraea fuscirosea TaxID=1291556 RepID=A0A2T0MLW6_9ACTN|nr:DUF4235 domain-containing protein [Nonomuraea fuscirosea]PRX58712.1 uncharacterized protein DUF4235 [Nonomuraea fuscirosea]WSA53525.1 DUF4235 domain-containing protein [Nonomuraea fuscirosea]
MQPLEKVTALGMSLASGALAVALAKKVWTLATGQDEAPDAEDLDRGWTEVLVAAAVQGAIFGLVRAAVQRTGARTFQRRGR